MPFGTLLINKIIMNENLKRYIVSSLVSFLTGFAMVFVANIDNITLESLRDGSIIGVIFLAIRAGVKGIAELFLLTFKE